MVSSQSCRTLSPISQNQYGQWAGIMGAVVQQCQERTTIPIPSLMFLLVAD